MLRTFGVRAVSTLMIDDNRRLWLAVATVLTVVFVMALTADPAVAAEITTDPTGVGDVSSGP